MNDTNLFIGVLLTMLAFLGGVGLAYDVGKRSIIRTCDSTEVFTYEDVLYYCGRVSGDEEKRRIIRDRYLR
jgi:hypothetical protein